MRNREFLNKVGKVRDIMNSRGIPGIMINNQANFSWLTGGRGFIGIATEKSSCSVLVMPDKVYFLTNNIEAKRLENEELSGLDGEFSVFPWYEEAKRNDLIKGIIPPEILVSDDSLSSEFRQLRSVMTEDELEKYRWLGATAATATEKIAREIKPGITEQEAWGLLANEGLKYGIEPATILIGFDDRIYKYRHPLPTEKKLENYAMLAVCIRKWGLYVSCSRFVSFSKPDEALAKKFKAVAAVDAALIANTRPGNELSNIFNTAVGIYEKTGFPEEWRNHHQGGLTGYMSREYRVCESTTGIVKLNQAYAWNPSIAGTKSEDTIIVGTDKNYIITHTGEYEYIEVEYNGERYLRPGVLIR